MPKTSVRLALTLGLIGLLISACGRKDAMNSEGQPSEFPQSPGIENPVILGLEPEASEAEPSSNTSASSSPGVVLPLPPEQASQSLPHDPSATSDRFKFSERRVGELKPDINPLNMFFPADELGGLDSRLKEGSGEVIQSYSYYLSGLVSRQIMNRQIRTFDSDIPAVSRDAIQVVNRVEAALDTTVLPGHTEQWFRCDDIRVNQAVRKVACQKVREFVESDAERREIAKSLGVTTASFETCRIQDFKGIDEEKAEQHKLRNIQLVSRATGTFKLKSGQEVPKVEQRIVRETGEIICGKPGEFRTVGRGVKMTETIQTFEQPSLEFLDRSIAKELVRVEELQIEASSRADGTPEYRVIQQSRVEIVEISQSGTKKPSAP